MGISLTYGLDSELGFQSDSSDLMNVFLVIHTDPGFIWVPLAMIFPRYLQFFTSSESEIPFVLRMGG